MSQTPKRWCEVDPGCLTVILLLYLAWAFHGVLDRQAKALERIAVAVEASK